MDQKAGGVSVANSHCETSGADGGASRAKSHSRAGDQHSGDQGEAGDHQDGAEDHQGKTGKDTHHGGVSRSGGYGGTGTGSTKMAITESTETSGVASVLATEPAGITKS